MHDGMSPRIFNPGPRTRVTGSRTPGTSSESHPHGLLNVRGSTQRLNKAHPCRPAGSSPPRACFTPGMAAHAQGKRDKTKVPSHVRPGDNEGLSAHPLGPPSFRIYFNTVSKFITPVCNSEPGVNSGASDPGGGVGEPDSRSRAIRATRSPTLARPTPDPLDPCIEHPATAVAWSTMHRAFRHAATVGGLGPSGEYASPRTSGTLPKECRPQGRGEPIPPSRLLARGSPC